MKRLFLLFLILSGSQIIAQEKATLNITGITAEAEKKALKGDMISYFAYDNGGSSRNIHVKVISSSTKRRFFESVDVRPDVNGHYDFSATVEIKEDSRLSFDSEVEIIVSMPTIYGNVFWTKVKRTKENMGDPIVLDNYSEKADKDYEPRKRLDITFSSISYDKDLKKKVTDNGDDWKDRKREDFTIKLKNVGDADWKIDQQVKSGMLTNGREVNAVIPYNDELDFSKKIIIRGECLTTKGNILWNEIEVEARGITQVFSGENYLIVESTPDADAQDTSAQEEDKDEDNDSDDDKEEVKEETVEEGNSTETGNTTTTNTSNDPIGTTTTTTTTTTLVKPGYGAATDLSTVTIAAECDNMASGDTLLLMNGSKVCIKSYKGAGSKNMTGTLAMDCNIKVGNTIFPLQGGQGIQFSKSDGSLTEGILREDLNYSSSVGAIVLKKGSKVVLRSGQLIGGSLAEQAKITVDGESFDCQPNSSVEQDIRFDGQGKLVECTIASDKAWNQGIDITFPAGSRLIYKSGYLSKVLSPKESSVTVAGQTFAVDADDKLFAYEFASKMVLKEINSGSGNTIDIEGAAIKVKKGTSIKFTEEGGAYKVERFYVEEEVTVNVYKKGKTKETVVKAGKRIVFKDGQVVKAG